MNERRPFPDHGHSHGPARARVAVVSRLAADWARETDAAAKDLSALINAAGLVVPVERIWMWPDERTAEAEAWAIVASARIAAGSAVIPQPPAWLLKESL